MIAETFSTVTDEGFTEVTDGSDHGDSGSWNCVFDCAVTYHAFDTSTMSTLNDTLNSLTEVAEGSGLLSSKALNALHDCVA